MDTLTVQQQNRQQFKMPFHMLLLIYLQFMAMVNISNQLSPPNLTKTSLGISRIFEFYEPLPQNFLIAHNSINDNDESFTALNFQLIREPSKKLQIILNNLYLQPSADRECSLDMSVRDNAARAEVIEVKRLIDNKVVFAWYDELRGGLDRKTRIVVVDVDECRVINRDLNDLKGILVIVPAVDGNFISGNFEVIFENHNICKGVGNLCVSDYDLEFDEYNKAKPMNFGFDFKNLRIERLSDGDIVARGFAGSAYKLILMNHSTGKSKILMSLMATHHRLAFVSSGLSACWIYHPGTDLSVNCAQFGKNGSLIFSKKINFNGTVHATPKIIGVHGIDEGEIVLFSERKECENENDCWNLIVTRIRKNVNYVVPKLAKFQCTGSRTKLSIIKISEMNGGIDVRYACKHENGYTYDDNYVDLTEGKNLESINAQNVICHTSNDELHCF